MRGTAATLAAGALLVLFWWMAAIVVARARHHVRIAVHITTLFSGDSKSWLSAIEKTV